MNSLINITHSQHLSKFSTSLFLKLLTCNMLSNHFPKMYQVLLSLALWGFHKYSSQYWVFLISNLLHWLILVSYFKPKLSESGITLSHESSPDPLRIHFIPKCSFYFSKLSTYLQLSKKDQIQLTVPSAPGEQMWIAAPSLWEYPWCTWAAHAQLIPLLIRIYCE